MGKVVKGLKGADGNQIKADLESNGKVVIEGIELTTEEVLFDSELPDDFVSSEFEGGNVFVNTNVTLEIRQEAMARELIRRIQDMRKDLDLDVEANINSIPLHLIKYEDLNDNVVVNKYMFADEPSKLKEIYPLIPGAFFDKYTVVYSAPFFLEFLNKE